MIERMTNGAPHAAALHEGGTAVSDARISTESVAEVTEGPAVIEVEAENVVKKPAAKPKSKVGGRVAWTLSMVAVGGVVGAVIILGIKFIDGPVEAKAGTPTLKAATAAATPAVVSSVLSGLTFELSYPGAFDQVGNVKNDASATEQYTISNKNHSQRMIAVSVKSLPSSNIDEDSSYKFRLINPKDYAGQKVMLHTEPATIMTKSDHTEQTLFWAHQGRVLIVSFTSTDPRDDLTAYMDVVVKSARWRK